ncbi:glycogen-binding domain-containing protein, partial [Roseisolibacter sp. H3M3-2]|uniref:glycogen-binding domain-containing protein n=1 Tax=Roseisolibacter sp. H3M3-2 TaxID=3031323 RepID=UPI0023DB7676
ATREAPQAEAVDGAGAVRRLRVRAPGAGSVEVRGDWTDWRPIGLVRDGDAWVLAAPLPRGTRRLTVRADGGAWRVPANLAGADDDFGSRVGLLVVP